MAKINDALNDTLENLPISVAVFVVVRDLPKDYVETTVPFPGLKRKSNPPLSVGDFICFDGNKDYAYTYPDRKHTIWHFRWNPEWIECLTFIGYETINRS